MNIHTYIYILKIGRRKWLYIFVIKIWIIYQSINLLVFKQLHKTLMEKIVDNKNNYAYVNKHFDTKGDICI